MAFGPLTLALGGLIVATLASFASWSEAGLTQGAFIVTMALAALKGHVIAAWFMSLRTAPRSWLWLFDAMLAATVLATSALHVAAG